jgi:surface carbohydrate biosynthesis protein
MSVSWQQSETNSNVYNLQMPMHRYAKYLRKMVCILIHGEIEVSWQRLKPVDLVIWDEVGSQFVLDALGPTSYYILRSRQNPIYLHPSIVWATLISTLTKRNTHHGIVIQQCQPRCVVTLIDNNPRFHKLASKLPNVRFVAIQNGSRKGFADEPQALGPPETYDSEYLCFGQNEIDSYEKIGYKFKKIEAVGSLRNALFAQHLNQLTEDFHVGERYDIALISQFRRPVSDSFPMFLVEYEKVVSLLYSYLRSHPGLRISVALVTASDHLDHEAELLFHRQRLGGLATLIPKSEDLMSSYFLTEQSNVVVTNASTLGLESLARGRKTLVSSSLYSKATVGQQSFVDWTCSSLDQEIFDEAITNLLAMSREKFLSRNSESINYVMIAPCENSISEFRRKLNG